MTDRYLSSYGVHELIPNVWRHEHDSFYINPEDFYGPRRAQLQQEITKQMQKSLDRLAMEMFGCERGPTVQLVKKEKTMRKFVLKATRPGYGPYFKTEAFHPRSLHSSDIVRATRFDTRDAAEQAIESTSRNLGGIYSLGLVTREVEVTPGARELRVVGEGEPRTGYVVNVYDHEWYIDANTPGCSTALGKATMFPTLGTASRALAAYVNSWDRGNYLKSPANILPVFASYTEETVTEVPGQ